MLKTVREAFIVYLAQFVALIAEFSLNKSANVAIITAVSAIPVISAVGCVIDYTSASMIRAKLQAAADAATLATVSANSSVVATAKKMTKSGTVSNGSTYADNFFDADAASTTNYSNLNATPTSTVTLSGTTMTATVSFTASYPTFFLGIIGYKTIALSGTSTASYSFPSYIDFYMMLDVSGSMGFPSTSSEQARLEAVNPDNMLGSLGYLGGCTFACHYTAQGVCSQSSPSNPYQGPYPPVGTSRNPGTNPSPGGYCQGYIITRLGTTPVSFASGNNSVNGASVNWNNTQVTSCPNPGTTSCIQLRLDAVGYAINELLTTAYNTEQSTGISKQFEVGLYPFIVNLCTSSSCSFPLTSTLSSGSSIYTWAAQLATYLDTGQNTTLGSGGTHFENAFPSMNTLITSVGTGTSSSNALPYVFLITDGVENSQTYPPFDGSNPTTMNSSLCTTLKNRGITIAVLYIPYMPIQNPNAAFAGDEDGAVNAIIPPTSNNVPNALQSCASPNFFYTANTPADINAALVTMFEQAVSTAHITN